MFWLLAPSLSSDSETTAGESFSRDAHRALLSPEFGHSLRARMFDAFVGERTFRKS